MTSVMPRAVPLCFFLISVSYKLPYTAISSLLTQLSHLYGPEILLQLNLCYFLPSIPILVLQTLFNDKMDRHFGTPQATAMRLSLGLGSLVFLSALFPTLATTHTSLLVVTTLVGATYGVAFGTSYQLASKFPPSSTVALTIGFVFSGVVVLVLDLSLKSGMSYDRKALGRLFMMVAAIIAVGWFAALCLVISSWKLLACSPCQRKTIRYLQQLQGANIKISEHHTQQSLSRAPLVFTTEHQQPQQQHQPHHLRQQQPKTHIVPGFSTRYSQLSHGPDPSASNIHTLPAPQQPSLDPQHTDINSQHHHYGHDVEAQHRWSNGNSGDPPDPGSANAGDDVISKVLQGGRDSTSSSKSPDVGLATAHHRHTSNSCKGGQLKFDNEDSFGSRSYGGDDLDDKAGKPEMSLLLLLRRISPAACAIFLSVGTSMLMFPFFTYVQSTGLFGERLPQVLFYVRLGGDILGRLVPSRYQSTRVSSLLGWVVVKTSMVPVIFVSIFKPAVTFGDAGAVLLVGVFWILSGYLNTCAYLVAPSLVPAGQRARASGLMTVAFQSACVTALLLAAALQAL